MPMMSSPQPIGRNEVLVVVKMSRFERDKARLGPNETVQDLMDRYKRMGEHGSRILTSHFAQEEAVNSVKAELTPDQVVGLDGLTPDLNGYRLIVALGGDDFFKMVAARVHAMHHKDDDVMLLGVNSDPATSRGALLPVTAKQFGQTLDRLEKGHYQIEPWTQIRVTVDGEEYPPALNEVYLGHRDSRQTSKHQMVFNGEKVLQRGSGLIVSTGTGSTGWYSSAAMYLGRSDDDDDDDRTFPKTAPMLKFVLREPIPDKRDQSPAVQGIKLPRLADGSVLEGQTLRIVSLNDDGGIVSCDCVGDVPFGRGSVAEITVHPSPLYVVQPGVS